MSGSWCVVAVAVVVAVAGAAVETVQLSLDSVSCGQLTCSLEEYCSPETRRCAPCNVVCNNTSHNYDLGLCKKECAVYLLDMRYMHKTDAVAPVSTDHSGVAIQAQAALVLSCLALATLLLILLLMCRGKLAWTFFKQKFNKNRVKQRPVDLTHHNPHAEMPKSKPELKLEIRNPEPGKRSGQPLNVHNLETRTTHTEKSQGATTPKTISTALSNRHPAEDTTLDFAYDNMAMNVTPPEQATHRF